MTERAVAELSGRHRSRAAGAGRPRAVTPTCPRLHSRRSAQARTSTGDALAETRDGCASCESHEDRYGRCLSVENLFRIQDAKLALAPSVPITSSPRGTGRPSAGGSCESELQRAARDRGDRVYTPPARGRDPCARTEEGRSPGDAIVAARRAGLSTPEEETSPARPFPTQRNPP